MYTVKFLAWFKTHSYRIFYSKTLWVMFKKQVSWSAWILCRKMPKASKSKEGSKIRTDRCFNPLNLSSHPSLNKKESLRSVSEKILLALNIPITKESLKQKICNTCRLRLAKNNRNDNELQSHKVWMMVHIYMFVEFYRLHHLALTAVSVKLSHRRECT